MLLYRPSVKRESVLRPRYLFKRKDSDNWYVRLQPPGQKVIERSLGTSDVRAAELAADDLIKRHKQFMYQRRSTRVARVEHGPWLHEYAPGLHTLPDGQTVMATERDLTFSDGTRRPNGGPAIAITGPRLSALREFQTFDDAYDGKIGEGPIDDGRPKRPVKSDDDALLELYIEHNGLTGLREKQARDIWHIFRTVVNKPIAKCTRDDGRAIIRHLEKDGEIKSATLRRRMVPLVATVNLAIDEGKLTFNPFSGVVPDRDDEDEREAFDDNDMKLIRDNLHLLEGNDQLLVRLLATTGVRRGEAFEIDSEGTENGIRFVTIGTKTPQSLRRIPLPADLLPYLPPKIRGRLIPGRMDAAGKRLRKWLTKIGITDPDKAPMHSFRHRAAQRLRAAIPDESLREAIGGWANGKGKKTSRKYGNKHGKGFPITMLKEAIDTIGM